MLQVQALTGSQSGAGHDGEYMYMYIRVKPADYVHIYSLFGDKVPDHKYTIEFDLTSETPCITREDIESVSVQGYPGYYNNGWFASSIITRTKSHCKDYSVLTSNPSLNKWIGYNEDTHQEVGEIFLRLFDYQN